MHKILYRHRKLEQTIVNTLCYPSSDDFLEGHPSWYYSRLAQARLTIQFSKVPPSKNASYGLFLS